MRLGRDFLVPMTPVHLGDIYPLIIFILKIYGQWMMYLNLEKDNVFFLGVAVLWISSQTFEILSLKKILWKRFLLRVLTVQNLQSQCQGASGIGTVPVNFLVAWRKIRSYVLYFCTKTERGILLALLPWFIKIDCIFVWLHALK